MKITFIFFCTIFIDAIAYGQVLERKKVTDDISMKVPSGFISMTDEERNQRYVSYKTPIAMYTNIERTVDLGVNLTSSEWGTGDLNILRDFYRSNILNLYNKVDFIQDEMREVGQRDYIVFEFTSKVYDENSFRQQVISKYTYIQYTLYNEKILLFHFTAPLQLKEKWQEAASEIMESVRLKS